eukprot:CAMPEP_0171321712 /NCGR_PEP_ID=MMETSP0816-20121228/114113_1 /TAXON_ID=420281 /ORGANISM="Proboscia inermis, Strain CCAP1064/1" /LENGTH=50 /DNA_ID=CAMNT_0011819977 /DNA_START=463 /DNA_END=615 /DNA_ORIENTATION=-
MGFHATRQFQQGTQIICERVGIIMQNVGFAFVPFSERVAIGDEGCEEYTA